MKSSAVSAIAVAFLAFLVGESLSARCLSAQAGPLQKRIVAHKISGTPPVIDGRLDDKSWEAAEVVSDFLQREPESGTRSTQRTTARVLYDDGAIYVAMRMYDTHPDSIRSPLSRRDNTDTPADLVAVEFDSNNDRRTAFRFITSPRGVQSDVRLYEDTREDNNWDAVWEVASRIDSLGWTAEFRIPLSQLRYTHPAPGRPDQWGINFARLISRRSELSQWSLAPRNSGRYVSMFGALGGLDDLAVSRRFEIMPYTLSRLTREPGDVASPFYNRNATAMAVGGDIKFGLTSNLTLTATINPDFGQVEADPSVVNLGAFETFFPEKRPFFTEGAEIFRFTMPPELQAFYSRRIGRAPQRFVDAPDAGYVDLPGASRILGAAKISGKTAGGWSVGMMHAVTAATDARTADHAGAITVEPVEPLAQYSVARVVHDFRQGQSGLGAIAVSTFRNIDDARLDFLRSRELAGGLNGWHRFGNRQYETRLLVIGSQVHGSQAAIAATQRNGVHRFQRPDSRVTYDTTITSMGGWGSDAAIRKIAGNWTGGLTSGIRSPGLDLNDAGYNTYSDTWYLAPEINYRNFEPGKYVRNWSNGVTLIPAWTFAGEQTRSMGEYRFNMNFSNLWNANFYAARWLRSVSPWELRGGPAILDEAFTDLTLEASTDSRREVSAGVETDLTYSEARSDRLLTIAPEVVFRPTDAATISLSPSGSWNRTDAQYIRTSTVGEAKHYIVGHLNQRTAALTARVSYVFSPELSLDVYAQPFLSAGHYATIREVASPKSRNFDERFSTFGPDRIKLDPATDRYSVSLRPNGPVDFTFGNPDFSVREFRANSVLRWQYRPGSTLFFVWSQARDDEVVTSGLPVRRELDRLFSGAARNVFLVKLSYWIGQ